MSVISGNEAVKSYINLNLVKVTTEPSGWDTLYLNKTSNQYWLHTYPNSEVHGGGQPQLQQVSEAFAKNKFGV